MRDSQQRNSDDSSGNQSFLALGSHAIQKMDYTTTNFNQNLKYF
jgi:hypothetical protein